MSYAQPPTITTEEAYRLELQRVFGSPAFKHWQPMTLLGWSADETSLRALELHCPGRLQRWDLRLGLVVEAVAVSPRYAHAACPLGASRALVRVRTSVPSAPFALEVWDLDAGLRSHDLPFGAADGFLASEDGRVFVVSDDGRSSVRSFPGGEPWLDAPGRPLALSADGSRLATRVHRKDRVLDLWWADGRPPATVAFEGEARLVCAVFSRDGEALIVGRSDGTVECRDAATGARRWSVVVSGGGVDAIARSPDGAAYFALGRDARLTALSPDGGSRWGVALTRGIDFEAQVLPSPSGALVAVRWHGVGLRCFDAATGAERSRIDGHLGAVGCVAVSADGRLVASGGDEGEVRVGDVATGETVWTLEVSPRGSGSVEFSRDGTALRTRGSDQVARRWDLARGLEEGPASELFDVDTRVHEAPDGSTVFFYGGLRLGRWREGSTGEVAWSRGPDGTLAEPDEPRRRFGDVACWPDASRVAVATGERGTDAIETFDAATGERVAAPARLTGSFEGLVETDAGPVSITTESIATDQDDVLLYDVLLTEEWGARVARRVPAAQEYVGLPHLSADRRWLVTENHHHVAVWDLRVPEARVVARVDLTPLDDELNDLALSPRGDLIVVGTRRGCVLIFALGDTVR